MSEMEGSNELPGLTSDMLAVSSCITPHGFAQPNTTRTPVQLPTGDTPNMMMNSVNR